VFDPIPILAGNPGPMTGEGNHTYLLAGSDGRAALIDAGVGAPQHISSIRAALASRRARLNDVLVTHAHGDHASGAPALAHEFRGVRFRKKLWPAQDERYPADWLPLEDGDRVTAGDEPLTVLFTPGHSPDHVAFWHEESRTLFSGDLVVSGTTVIIVASKGGDLSQYLTSLERVRSLAPAKLLPAHGPAIVEVEGIVTRYIEHRMRRERQVVEALAAGHDTVGSIAESIYHGIRPALASAAAENVRAHLEKLRKEGRASLRRAGAGEPEPDTWALT
jgi:glyoxylase-like metal-dependent hydrolase (beta-lactamase superfamily II)